MKVIPIIPHASQAAATGSCNEESGDVPKLNLPLTRRSLLRGSGVLLGTLAAGSALTALAPSRAWAVELKTLSSAEGTTLMKMGRTLFPHDKLPDAVYALLAKDLDAGATADSKTTAMLRDGIVSLDKAAGVKVFGQQRVHRIGQFGVREQRPAHFHQRRAFGATQGFQLDGPGA